MRRLALAFAASLLLLLALGPASASANHLCGGVILQDTTLTHDHSCPGAGLTIAAPRVTLNLAGFDLDGTGTSPGINFDGYDGVTVLGGGGQVKEFGFGIELPAGTQRAVISNVTVTNNQNSGIFIPTGANGNTIRVTHSSSNAGHGIQVAGNRNVIDTVALNFNAASGVSVQGFATGTDILNSTPVGNSVDGINVAGSTVRTLVKGSTSNSNVDDGIDTDSPKTTITSNSASNNGGWGIEAVVGVRDGGGNMASGNTAGECLNVSCTGVTSLLGVLQFGSSTETESSTELSETDLTDPASEGDGQGCDGPWTSTETEPGTNGDDNANGVVCTKEGPKGTMYEDDGGH
jgi:hypothetical protein